MSPLTPGRRGPGDAIEEGPSQDGAPSIRERVHTQMTPRGLHDHVVEQLAMKMVRGALPAGAILHPEEMMAEMSMSRTVVREAIRVIGAKGMIAARPRVGTRVLPREEWNLLDPQVVAWLVAAGMDAQLLRHLTELRAAIEPPAARLAAGRGMTKEIDRITIAAKRMRECLELQDHDRMTEADVEFHSSVLAASGNPFFGNLKLAFAIALEARDRLASSVFVVGHQEVSRHEKVAASIASCRPDDAERSMRRLVSASGRAAALLTKRIGESSG